MNDFVILFFDEIKKKIRISVIHKGHNRLSAELFWLSGGGFPLQSSPDGSAVTTCAT